jgi:ribose-phosphate pyrophosphokinase
MRDLKIVTGTANVELAKLIASYNQVPLVRALVDHFPDGETQVRIEENVRGSDLFIIQPTCPPANDNLMELLLLLDAAKRSSARRITAVLPYFGYARQDRKEESRVPISAKLVSDLISKAGAQRVLAFDLHAPQIVGFFDIPVDHMLAAGILIDFLNSHQAPAFLTPGENLVITAPDVGAMRRALTVSELAKSCFAMVAKKRKSPNETEATHIVGDVAGKNILLVDDMSLTAGTLVNAAELLKQHGAQKTGAFVTHYLLNQKALDRLEASPIDVMLTTDTVPLTVNDHNLVTSGRLIRLTCAPLLGEAIRRINNEESMQGLFPPV